MPNVNRQTAINVMGSVMATFIACCLAYSLYALVNREIPSANRDAFMVIVGLIAGCINMVFNWLFGSSQESKKQSEAIANQSETIKVAQAALTPTVSAIPVGEGETVAVTGTGDTDAAPPPR